MILKIHLFLGGEKSFISFTGCFPIRRQGAVLHSVRQTSVFYNLKLEEAFKDLLMEILCQLICLKVDSAATFQSNKIVVVQ